MKNNLEVNGRTKLKNTLEVSGRTEIGGTIKYKGIIKQSIPEITPIYYAETNLKIL